MQGPDLVAQREAWRQKDQFRGQDEEGEEGRPETLSP